MIYQLIRIDKENEIDIEWVIGSFCSEKDISDEVVAYYAKEYESEMQRLGLDKKARWKVVELETLYIPEGINRC